MSTLSKRVLAHTKTVAFRWCKLEWMEMSKQFRNIRAGARKKLNTCFWCRHKFTDGEMMALAAREQAGNVVLCRQCGEELLASEDTP